MQYNKIVFIGREASHRISEDGGGPSDDPTPSDGALYYVCESIQVSSCHSSPIFDTMKNLLQFIYDYVVVPRAKIEQQKFLDCCLGASHLSPSHHALDRQIEQTLMTQIECIASVALQHLYFQDNCFHGISLQEQKDNRSHSDQQSVAYLQTLKKNSGVKFNFRNFYHNNNEFKIDDFDFQLLFKKIPNFDVILQLIRSLLLEKKIIMIENDTSDMAIIMQTLITLIQPFRWHYTMITDLPANMIEALEAPQPFLIGIQKKLWDQKCKVQMMDNIVEENFVIFDLDLGETRGLTDIYDPLSDQLQNVQFPK